MSQLVDIGQEKKKLTFMNDFCVVLQLPNQIEKAEYFGTEHTSGYVKLYSLNLLSKKAGARGCHGSNISKIVYIQRMLSISSFHLQFSNFVQN